MDLHKESFLHVVVVVVVPPTKEIKITSETTTKEIKITFNNKGNQDKP